jgi:hypothetical protein
VERPTMREVVQMLTEAKQPNAYHKQWLHQPNATHHNHYRSC